MSAMQTSLRGQIERITYTNDEDGYTIAKVRVEGRSEPVTVVGNLFSPMVGEVLEMTGEWSRHPRYGEQFRVERHRSSVPASVEGMRRYLGSGLIKGIGPVMARRIVARFGARTFRVIEEEPGRLSEVQGIGRKRIETISRAWEEQKEIRDVMVFLQSHGMGSAHAAKIFKRYGSRSIQAIRKNPYRLASDIFGIGFLTADRVARNLGVSRDSPLRAGAGILHVLRGLADEGHVYYPYERLIKRCAALLEVEDAVVRDALGRAAAEGVVVIEDLNENPQTCHGDHMAVYLAGYHRAEIGVAEGLVRLARSPKSLRPIDASKAMAWLQGRLPIRLAPGQRQAVKWVLDHKILIITGGPGTGKTTIIDAVLKIVSRVSRRILLAAPTGRAAKRMSEATGFQAKTIHRLLEFSPKTRRFQRDRERPLECDLLVVDEASMIDTILMHHLTKAVPDGATLVLVGDRDQLPSVGAGNVLRDLIDSGVVPVVHLNEIFRQARQSLIIVNAHRINQGKMPHTGSDRGKGDDFYFIEQEDPAQVLRIITELAAKRIPRRFGLDPMEDIQVLTPMHRGLVGADNLNAALQDALNPGPDAVSRGSRGFRVRDRVMQLRNNYEKDVFNGDIGRIARIDPETRQVEVLYDGRQVIYEYEDLDEIVPAYAVSIHKSQGSEYPAVIIPLLTQHFVMLQRNLIYTAVTRGRRLVVLVGSRKALAVGIGNNRSVERFTGLRRRLVSTWAGGGA